MRLLISFAALFLSVVLLQLGTGGIAPLDAISGLELGFSRGEIGLLGSAHFFGFFIGCWWAPRLLESSHVLACSFGMEHIHNTSSLGPTSCEIMINADDGTFALREMLCT